MPHPHYHPSMMYPQHHLPSGQQGHFDPSLQDPSLYPQMEGFNPDHVGAPGYAGHPQMGHIPAQASIPPGFPGSPGAAPPSQENPMYSQPQADPNGLENEQLVGEHTPYKYNPNQVPMSPYWGHLDHATLAMGILSPQGPPAPQTPARNETVSHGNTNEIKQENVHAVNAQPLLLRQQYYNYGVSEAVEKNHNPALA